MEYKQTPTGFTDPGRRLILKDIYGRLREHLRTWFPADPCRSKMKVVAETVAQSVLAPNDRAFLKSFDLVFCIKVASDLWALAQEGQKADYARQCLDLVAELADVTDQIAQEGILTYMQDTSAALLSAVGLTIHKAGI
mgnify:CR=1 FL=1|jgi:hypothetical protein